MSDFLENISNFLTQEFVKNSQKIIENPNAFSDNIINYLKKNNIGLNNNVDIDSSEKSINCDFFELENTDINVNENDYQALLLNLNHIQNIMTEIKEYLQKDN